MFTTNFARLIVGLTGHRLCCRIPAWTAHVGQRWETYDRALWNLYNALWRLGQWAMTRPGVMPR